MKKKNAAPPKISTTLSDTVIKIGLPQSELTAIRTWLAELLTSQEHAKLGQGGHTLTDVPLRRVFVDLPVINSQFDEGHDGRELFLERMLESAPLKLRNACKKNNDGLNNSTLEGEDEVDDDYILNNFNSENMFSATLLIGGPGQGKSTIGQLACQLHRASLLSPLVKDLTVTQQDLICTFSAAGREVVGDRPPLSLPLNPHLPLQISLPEFSAWLVKDVRSTKNGGLPLILRYLTDLPSAKLCGLSTETLLTFACHIPTLIVLDGFDEVGAKKDRIKLVSAAQELVNCLAEKDALAQIIVTTRPQGYAGEMAKIGIPLKERFLAPLSKNEALGYAKKLVEAKIPGVDLQLEMFKRLKEAAQESATERLLTTPLQVTILTALVQQLGRAPRERWNLFFRYFSYTYDREIERNTFASRLLSDHRSHIEQIHTRVALLLQVEAERSGGASARMSKARLESIIDAVLSEDEFPPDTRKELVKDIAIAAEQRLVFLVEPEPGSFGFEIRSLQEFMAAWALTSGRDSDIEDRLQQIARAPMFRNVVLFVISKLYTEGSPLRDVLADRICNLLNNDPNDEASRLTCAGSILALEALEEGAVLGQPKRARALMQQAINLLSLPTSAAHVRLARVSNDDTLQLLKDAIEQGIGDFGAGNNINKEAAWICVIDACNQRDQWAMKLGDKYWPKLEDPASIVNACRRLSMPLGEWISYRIDDVAHKISPETFLNAHSRSGDKEPISNWTTFLAATFNEERVWKNRMSRSTFIKLIPAKSVEEIVVGMIGNAPPAWKPWIAFANFENNPNKETLAIALEAAASSKLNKQWSYAVQWAFSWPLKVCLLKAVDDKQLQSFASLARQGELGDTSSWINAQKKWPRKISKSLILNAVNSEMPWTLSDINASPPIQVFPNWFLSSNLDQKQNGSTLRNFIEQFQKSNNPKVKRILGNACVAIAAKLPAKTLKKDLNISDWLVAANYESIGNLIPRPKWMDFETWLNHLDGAKKSIIHFSVLPTAQDAINSIIDSGGHPLLLLIAVQSFEMQWHREGLDYKLFESLKTQFEKITKISLLTREEKIDFSILQIYIGTMPSDRDKELIEDVVITANTNPEKWDQLVNALSAGKLASPRSDEMLGSIYRAISVSTYTSSIVIRHLRNTLQLRLTGLDRQVTWNRLKLPLPIPIEGTESAKENRLPLNPVAIEWLELKNICGIRNIKLRLNLFNDSMGQWTVILGPNGIGKTTLLRSLALGLRDVRDQSIWPKGTFTGEWQSVGHGGEPLAIASEIKIKIHSGSEYSTVIRSDTTFQSPTFDNPKLFPFFAYGCRRGSALGGAKREVSLNTTDGPEIATLFDDQADLIHAETWLIQLEGDAAKNKRSAVIFSAVIEALKSLLDVKDVEVRDRNVWISQLGRPSLRFSTLSDGYLTSAGWFMDLLARWIELAMDNDQSIEPNFMQTMRGLVLIDEIDLHLHPQWQIEIISRTRKLLPQMSFVVTTHNPLTLVGAKAEEIWVLSPDDENNVIAQCGLDTPMLLTSGQIYRRYFGIENIFPNGLGLSLQRYSFLCGSAMRNDDEEHELATLKSILAKAGINPEWEIVPREFISSAIDEGHVTKSSSKSISVNE